MRLRSLPESWRRDRYCHIGSTIPLRSSADEAVATPQRTLGYSRMRHFAQGVNLGLCPLIALRPLRSLTGPCCRSWWSGPRSRPEQLLSWGFVPLRRLSNDGATTLELASLQTLHSQGFSPSQCLAPRHAFRPCFMPVTPLGFHPSELSPLEEPCHLSAAGAFLTFTASRSRRGTRTCHAKRATPAVRFRRVREASTRCGIPHACGAYAPGRATKRAPRGRRTCSVAPRGRDPTGAPRDTWVAPPAEAGGDARGTRVPGGVEPSARRVKPKLHPPVGQPEHHAGDRTVGERCGRCRSTERVACRACRSLTSTAVDERRPGPKLGTARRGVEPSGDGKGRPVPAAAPKRSAEAPASHQPASLAASTGLPAPSRRPKPVWGRGVRRRTLGSRRGSSRAGSVPKHGPGPDGPGAGSRTPAVQLVHPAGRNPSGAVSAPSDRQATQGTGSGGHDRPEGRLGTAGRTRGPVPGHRGHPRRAWRRPKPAVDVLGGCLRTVGRSGDRSHSPGPHRSGAER
jgi:hypothetical protein